MPGAFEITRGELAGKCIALIEKSGCTSIGQSIKGAKAGVGLSLQATINSQIPMRLYLRHPITRIKSAWAYFSPSKFPIVGIPTNCTFECFVDKVLDHCMSNVHWNPVMPMLDKCNLVEVMQFERIRETWPADIKLLHLNASKRPKPETTYRLDDLEEFYRRDLDTWLAANPILKLNASNTRSTNAAG